MQNFDGAIVTYVCFNCAVIDRAYIKSARALKQYYNVHIVKGRCLHCKGDKHYFKDQFSIPLKMEDYIKTN